MRGLIQEIGGGAPDLQRPPTARRSVSEVATWERWEGRGWVEGTPPPLGGRGAPEEQEQSVVAQIVNSLSGISPPSSQARDPTDDRPDPPGGSRGRGAEVGAAAEEMEAGGCT